MCLCVCVGTVFAWGRAPGATFQDVTPQIILQLRYLYEWGERQLDQSQHQQHWQHQRTHLACLLLAPPSSSVVVYRVCYKILMSNGVSCCLLVSGLLRKPETKHSRLVVQGAHTTAIGRLLITRESNRPLAGKRERKQQQQTSTLRQQRLSTSAVGGARALSAGERRIETGAS